MGRESYDHYPTPSWCVERLLEATRLPGGNWLEPAVGDGAIVRTVEAIRSDVTWTTVDVRPDAAPPTPEERHLYADFLAWGCPDLDVLVPEGGQRLGWAWDVVITNPPYSQAEEFVRAAQSEAPIVVMLLRLGYLATTRRAKQLRSHMPAEVLVLPERPTFTGGGTDMSEYAWFIWRAPWLRTIGDVRILRSTPLRERQRKDSKS